MIAIDDGSHTNYSSTTGPGFPLVHVAALDRPGSTKGGPYTHGPVPSGGHFGIVNLVPSADGASLNVEIACMKYRREQLLTLSFSVPTSPAAAT